MSDQAVADTPVEGACPDWGRLPCVATGLGEAQVLERLERLARDGKLAGFRVLGARSFEVSAFGEPFDRRLVATLAQDGPRTRLNLKAPLVARMPVIYALIIAVSIWPGVWLTHSMLSTYWNWYGRWPEWVTWAWYMPLTVVPLFFMLPKMMRKSERACYEHAMEQVGKITEAVSGSIETR